MNATVTTGAPRLDLNPNHNLNPAQPDGSTGTIAGAPSDTASQKDAGSTEGQAAERAVASRPARRRRGPPADGGGEERAQAILTTSRMPTGNGVSLRRGQVVSVPTRRLDALKAAGRIRTATSEEIERAIKRHGSAVIV